MEAVGREALPSIQKRTICTGNSKFTNPNTTNSPNNCQNLNKQYYHYPFPYVPPANSN